MISPSERATTRASERLVTDAGILESLVLAPLGIG
jgi:hypothetical protein